MKRILIALMFFTSAYAQAPDPADWGRIASNIPDPQYYCACSTNISDGRKLYSADASMMVDRGCREYEGIPVTVEGRRRGEVAAVGSTLLCDRLVQDKNYRAAAIVSDTPNLYGQQIRDLQQQINELKNATAEPASTPPQDFDHPTRSEPVPQYTPPPQKTDAEKIRDGWIWERTPGGGMTLRPPRPSDNWKGGHN
jgi:hypothetical protein